MAAKTIKTVLLNAFPAGGKSEIRKLLGHEKALCKSFMLGDFVQLDDYPYVKFMRDIDDALGELGQHRIFFDLPDRGFVSNFDWGTLAKLVNEDYDDLINHATMPEVRSATRWLVERIDRARRAVGIRVFLSDLPASVLWGLEDRLEPLVREFLRNKYADIPESMEGKTVFIEFSRGGPEGSTFPLPAPHGYQYTYSMLSDAILENAAVLYVWVTAEQSRAKNIARGQESVSSAPAQATASSEAARYVLSLNHTVPQWVMFNSYGVDDVDFLLRTSDRPNTVKIIRDGKTFYLPVARFDNRPDFTSFCRGRPEDWAEKDREAIKQQLSKAFAELIEQYKLIHP